MSAQQNAPHQQDGAAVYNIPPEPTAPGTRASRDQDGACYYDAPIPGMADGAVYPFRDWESHIDYMFFSKTGTNRNGGQVVYIKPWEGAREPPTIQLVDLTYDQPMRTPFGLRGVTTHPKTGKPIGSDERPNLELSFDNAERQEAFFRRVDDNIRRAAGGFRFPKWFAGSSAAARPVILSDNYKPIVANPAPSVADKGYRPTMRTKFSLYNDRKPEENTIVWQATAVGGDYSLKPITDHKEIFDLLQANARVIPIVQIASIWFILKGEWGVTIQVSEIIVMPSAERQRGVFHGMNIVPAPVSTSSSPVQTDVSGVGHSPQSTDSWPQHQAQYDASGAPMDVVGEGFVPADNNYPAFDGNA
ncbi:hypothetical protein psal_cds_318 [Pandoravirus salinus]|uniref:Uncharacterized protein n=1 Tax=Pandoravirus salinus TaxID=1349410 RepID=S4W0N3_9VIRU|nr:hypothetical protein psal_cds_318 [Pandoravirus salinus]AGO83937.1 hypothetical protein psal_cds_318 [Pandoravirus salinus]